MVKGRARASDPEPRSQAQARGPGPMAPCPRSWALAHGPRSWAHGRKGPNILKLQIHRQRAALLVLQGLGLVWVGFLLALWPYWEIYRTRRKSKDLRAHSNSKSNILDIPSMA